MGPLRRNTCYQHPMQMQTQMGPCTWQTLSPPRLFLECVSLKTFHDAFLASCRKFLQCTDAADMKTCCPHPFRITATAAQFLRLSGSFLPRREEVEQCRPSSCHLTLHRHLPLESQPVVHQDAVVSRLWPRHLAPGSFVHDSFHMLPLCSSVLFFGQLIGIGLACQSDGNRRK